MAVSALVFRAGALRWLTDLWRSETISMLVSIETKSELTRVIADPKFQLTGEDQDNLLKDYLDWRQTFDVQDPPDVPECRDPADRPFLELALAAGADALVTGDADLLAPAPGFPVPIITPRALRDLVERLQGSPWRRGKRLTRHCRCGGNDGLGWERPVGATLVVAPASPRIRRRIPPTAGAPTRGAPTGHPRSGRRPRRRRENRRFSFPYAAPSPAGGAAWRCGR